jgi:hypothetical protein
LGDDRTGRGAMQGASADGAPAKPLTETWHDALLGYSGNNPRARDQVDSLALFESSLVKVVTSRVKRGGSRLHVTLFFVAWKPHT